MAGVSPGDHVCVSFGSDDEHRAIVGRYARQALDHGDRLLYFTHRSDESTIRAYLDEAGIDATAGLALRQIEIRPIEHTAGSLDPEALIASLQADRRLALHDGYRALAGLSEMSWALDRPDDADLVLDYERAVDRVFAGADIAGLCQYDRRLFPEEFLDRLVSSHTFQICTSACASTTARRRLSIAEGDDGTVTLSGALDIDSSAYLAARLAEQPLDRDLVVWTSDLGFADISGCRALATAAERLHDGHYLVVPDPAPALVRVMELCGWTHHPQLVLGE